MGEGDGEEAWRVRVNMAKVAAARKRGGRGYGGDGKGRSAERVAYAALVSYLSGAPPGHAWRCPWCPCFLGVYVHVSCPMFGPGVAAQAENGHLGMFALLGGRVRANMELARYLQWWE